MGKRADYRRPSALARRDRTLDGGRFELNVPARPAARTKGPAAWRLGHATREEKSGSDSPGADRLAQGVVPWRYVLRRVPLASSLATAFGVGLLPGPAGTWGSLATVVAAEALFWTWGSGAVLLLAVASSLVGPWAAGRTAVERGAHDPNEVVVDEVAGQSIALCGLHLVFPRLGADGIGAPYLVALLLAFALFRLLDIFKPGPIGALERLPGGLGIMADDLLAGLLVALAFVLAGALGAGRFLT